MEYRKFSTFIDSVQYGYTADETSLTEGDAKYLRITDIVPYFVDKERVPFCKINSKNKDKYKVYENDLLIARTGATTGFNLIVPKGFDNYVFASYLIRFNYNQETLYPQYLKHVLKSQQYYGFVKNYIGGSAQPGMNPKGFSRFEIPYVEYNIQKRIASILSAYDDLIENNNKRIKILEKMAENLYKEWFVRFRFPGHEQADFENGIPKGWASCKLREIIRIRYGKDHKDLEDGTIPVFGSGGVMRYGNRALYSGETVMIPRKGSLQNVTYYKGDLWTVDTMFYTEFKVPTCASYLYFTLSQFDLESLNKGASIPSLSTDILYNLKIVLPPQGLRNQFQQMIDVLNAQTEKLTLQNQNLTRQRDLLLPRLMSGKLEV